MSILMRSSSTKSAAASACSSRSIGAVASDFARTLTIASWPPTPKNPPFGSCTTSTIAPSSEIPRSARAASTASATDPADFSTSGATLAPSLGPLRLGPSTRRPARGSPSRIRSPGAASLRPALGGPALSGASLRRPSACATALCTATIPAGLGWALTRWLAALALLLCPLHHRREPALPARLVRLGSLPRPLLGDPTFDRLGADVTGPQQSPLLADHEQVRDRPVQDEACREAEPDEPEHQGHDPKDRLLLLRRGARRADALHLELLVERRRDHEGEQDQVGDLRRDPRTAAEGGLTRDGVPARGHRLPISQHRSAADDRRPRGVVDRDLFLSAVASRAHQVHAGNERRVAVLEHIDEQLAVGRKMTVDSRVGGLRVVCDRLESGSSYHCVHGNQDRDFFFNGTATTE